MRHVDVEILEVLRRFFSSEGTDEPQTLDFEGFCAAFGETMGAEGGAGRASSHENLRQLFMRIDANSDGVVDWDEFTNFLLCTKPADLREGDAHQLALVSARRHSEFAHKDAISVIATITRPFSAYVTGSRDGTVRFWAPGTLRHLRTVRHRHHANAAAAAAGLALAGAPGSASSATPASHEHAAPGQPVWVQGLAAMPLSHRLAVISADRCLTFYDLFTFEAVGRVTQLPHAPSALVVATFTEPTPGHQVLAMGDLGGVVRVVKLAKDFALDTFSESAAPGTGPGAPLRGRGVLASACDCLHTDWIVAAKWIDLLELLVTCSLDATVCLYDVHKLAPLRVFRGHRFGVRDFVWCHATKFMASCGTSRQVLMWDPYSLSSMGELDGHVAPVVALAVDDERARVISVALDKVIKCWCARTLRCVQTLADDTSYRPENIVSAVHYDASARAMLTAGNRLTLWHLRAAARAVPKAKRTHDGAVCAALCNGRQVVSGDTHGTVCTWDVEHGELALRFTKAHGDAKITAMSFDAGLRRLITGADDGAVHLWSFNNGQRLRTFGNGEATTRAAPASPPLVATPTSARGRPASRAGGRPASRAGRPVSRARTADSASIADKLSTSSTLTPHQVENEVTTVLHVTESGGHDVTNRYVITAGDRTLKLFSDEDAAVPSAAVAPTRVMAGHVDDVQCIAHCPPMLVASGSDDGRIILWSLDTARPKFHLDASQYDEGPLGSADAAATDHVRASAHDASAGGLPHSLRRVRANSVDCMIYLRRQRVLVTAGADGRIRFWNIKTGTLAFIVPSATHSGLSETGGGGHAITAMATDESRGNAHLFTGSAGGYVKILRLLEGEELGLRRVLRKTQAGDGGAAAASTTAAMDLSNAGPTTPHRPIATAPALGRRTGLGARTHQHGTRRAARAAIVELGAWRAHDDAVTSVVFVGTNAEGELAAHTSAGHGLLLSASRDGDVSLWTMLGACVGVFGAATTPWALDRPATWATRSDALPQASYVADDESSRASRDETPTDGPVHGDGRKYEQLRELEALERRALRLALERRVQKKSAGLLGGLDITEDDNNSRAELAKRLEEKWRSAPPKPRGEAPQHANGGTNDRMRARLLQQLPTRQLAIHPPRELKYGLFQDAHDEKFPDRSRLE